MSLNLDARQRAMLQEMGITLWWPQSAAAPAAPSAPSIAPQVRAAVDVAAPVPQTVPPVIERAPAEASPPAPAPSAASARAMEPAAPAVPRAPVTPVDTPVWHMAPRVRVYPQAQGAAVGGAWLVLLESACPMTPLAGEVGKLLDNMLRALGLHHHPQVYVAGLQRPGSQALPVAGSLEPVDWLPLAPSLQTALAQVQPARVLVLGLHAAWAVLQRSEPLGQLRAQVHTLQGIPAVVSYDPSYLLRAPHAKPAAWADLCLAQRTGAGA